MTRRRQKPHSLHREDGLELINLTPLLDVLFVVLIMFILVAPMLDVDKVNLASGKRTSSDEETLQKSPPLAIYVNENNQIKLNKQSISLKHLESALQAIYLQNPREIPTLYQDKNSSFGTYQKIKNMLEDTGFEELDIIVKSDE